ncbi:hypothetical protein PQ455_14750 [Sphingomonas naphthae]|uniref:Type II secretion system protein M n=1 Tax=Sphingomonas naphthae TaxID=1813468 RepID=A0ABY7TKV8_9SPHN|nr:hypothetical protein [Sphingomonas naphthae]WCT72884.1 hypothetical protein PQ455_14750 [Sphingomonas naphthae]
MRSGRKRAVAASLAIIAALLGLALLRPALLHLDAARARQAILLDISANATPPVPHLVPAGEAAPVRSQAEAQALLAATLREIAVREGLLVEAIGPAEAQAPSIATARLLLSGNERAMLRFAEAVESRQPLIRFARWRLTGGGTLRLEAEAAMPWGAGR